MITAIYLCKVTTYLQREYSVYLAGDKVKLGLTGIPDDVSNVYGYMDKGNARTLRKSLHAVGRVDLAAAPRKIFK